MRYSFVFLDPRGGGGADALTSANISNATKAGGGAELWNGSKFNDTVLKDIVSKLFKGVSPVEYIKSKGAAEWNNYGKNAPTTSAAEKNKQYWVVPASTINSNIGNSNYGMVIYLNGKYWMVTSLTLDNSGSVVATLMLSNPLGSATININTSSAGANVKGDNMYSRSTLRNTLLTNSNWSLFKSTSSFAQKYLVQPKNIQYQRTESQLGKTNTWFDTHSANEALVAFSSGWEANGRYDPGYTAGGYAYEAWGNDYIWIPSCTEVGGYSTSQQQDVVSIWALTNYQRYFTAASSSTADTVAWYRSGYMKSYGGEFTLSSTGNVHYDLANTTHAIRPAIHLNLSAAMADSTENFYLTNPSNITTTYTGSAQSVESAHLASSLSWYDTTYYKQPSSYINISYEFNGATVPSIMNAGVYWVKFEISSTWVDNVNNEVAKDKAKWGWTSSQESTVKTRRSPKFNGSATTKEGHTESATIRWVKFTINKKEISINKPTYNSATGQFGAPTFAENMSTFADVPVLATRFTGKRGTERQLTKSTLFRQRGVLRRTRRKLFWLTLRAIRPNIAAGTSPLKTLQICIARLRSAEPA